MGGIGNGSYCRIGKTTTDEALRLSINAVNIGGRPQPGKSGTFTWSVNGEETDSINYVNRLDGLLLRFKTKAFRGEWEDVRQIIHYDHTPCNYGGTRLWFHCPACHRRVGVLYSPHGSFLCRHCHKLPYASQNRAYRDSLIAQKHRLGQRIFERYERGIGYGKKKGMHWKTFNRLHAIYEEKEQRWLGGIAAYLRWRQ